MTHNIVMINIPNAGNAAIFAANSLLVVNAEGLAEGTAMLKATSGTLSVDAAAKLHILGGKGEPEITVVSDFTNAASAVVEGGWSGDNLTLSSSMLLMFSIYRHVKLRSRKGIWSGRAFLKNEWEHVVTYRIAKMHTYYFVIDKHLKVSNSRFVISFCDCSEKSMECCCCICCIQAALSFHTSKAII